jgi:hypothetical protein
MTDDSRCTTHDKRRDTGPGDASFSTLTPAVEAAACEKAADCAEGLFCLGRVCAEKPEWKPVARDGGPARDAHDAADIAQEVDTGQSDSGDGGAAGDAEVDAGCQWDEQCGQGYRCDGFTGVCEGVGSIKIDPNMIDPGCPVGPGVKYHFALSISNVGKGVLTILDMEIEQTERPDGGPPLFALKSPREPPFGLGQNETIELTVIYSPDDRRPDTGAVKILSDDPKYPFVRVPIVSGYKGAPDLSLVDRSTVPPATLYPLIGSTRDFKVDLGEVAPGTSGSRSLGIVNVLGCSDAILSVEIVSTFRWGVNEVSVEFGATRSEDGPSEPYFLNPGDLLDVRAGYSPTAPSGADGLTVVLRTNDADLDNDGRADDGILTLVFAGRTLSAHGSGSGFPDVDIGASAACEPCAPDCNHRECGDDGCGGSCGECDGYNSPPDCDEVVQLMSKCVHIDNFGRCDGWRCDKDPNGHCPCPDGWNCVNWRWCEPQTGYCPGIPPGGTCINGLLVTCADNVLSRDYCPPASECEIDSATGTARCSVPPCLPSCFGKTCGDDGCGGDCGPCPDDEECRSDLGVCVPEGGGCGRIGETGACLGHVFAKCDAGSLTLEPCLGRGEVCSDNPCTGRPECHYPWSGMPCGSLPESGECVSSGLFFGCRDGGMRVSECWRYQSSCRRVDLTSYGCVRC